jgi:hypothetical protein
MLPLVKIVDFQQSCRIDEREHGEPSLAAIPSGEPEAKYLPAGSPYAKYPDHDYQPYQCTTSRPNKRPNDCHLIHPDGTSWKGMADLF